MIDKFRLLFKVLRGRYNTIYYKMLYGKRLNIEGRIAVGKGFKLILGKNSRLTVKGDLATYDYCQINLKGGGDVTIGKGCIFNRFTSIVSHNKITIGNNVMCGEGVKIYDNDHKIYKGEIYKNEFKTTPITIGDNVWLSNGVMILRGSNIQDNVVVGALSLVSGKLEKGYLYMGTPAKKVMNLLRRDGMDKSPQGS